MKSSRSGSRWSLILLDFQKGRNLIQSLGYEPFHQGRTQRGFEGVHQIQLGVWGRCEPPSGVRGGAPEDFEINAFQRLGTPVSLSFLSQCSYTKIHAIFFIHSHPDHFQLNEVVPNHTL